jgi:long-chain fatty acid transport protein
MTDSPLLARHVRRLLALLALFATLAPTVPAEAGGLFLTDRGARPLGRGFAFVAGADDPQALWYNPAGIAWSEQQLLFDATLTFLYGSYTRTDSGGNVLAPVDIDAAVLPIPMLAYTHPIGDFTLGLGVHAPNATLLRWPYGVRDGGGTCDATTTEGASDPTCEPAPQRYSLFSLEGSAFVNVTPAVAWRRGGFAIGAGMHLMLGSFVGQTAMSACDGTLCSQPEDPEWDGVAQFTLSPIVHPGITLGVTYDAGPVRFGASFVWWPKAIRGDAELRSSTARAWTATKPPSSSRSRSSCARASRRVRCGVSASKPPSSSRRGRCKRPRRSPRRTSGSATRSRSATTRSARSRSHAT